jgi:hypothetical protein
VLQIGGGRLKPFAAAEGCDPQVERCVRGVTTLVDEILRCSVGLSNLDKLAGLRMVLTEVRAQSTLASVYRYHNCSAPFVALLLMSDTVTKGDSVSAAQGE